MNDQRLKTKSLFVLHLYDGMLAQFKHKLFSCRHQRTKDLLIMDLKELKTLRAPFLWVTYYLVIHKPSPGIKCACEHSGKLTHVYNISLVHRHYDIYFCCQDKKQWLYLHQDASKWESHGHIPVFILHIYLFVPFSLPQLHPPQFAHPRPQSQSFAVASGDSYHWFSFFSPLLCSLTAAPPNLSDSDRTMLQ